MAKKGNVKIKTLFSFIVLIYCISNPISSIILPHFALTLYFTGLWLVASEAVNVSQESSSAHFLCFFLCYGVKDNSEFTCRQSNRVIVVIIVLLVQDAFLLENTILVLILYFYFYILKMSK